MTPNELLKYSVSNPDLPVIVGRLPRLGSTTNPLVPPTPITTNLVALNDDDHPTAPDSNRRQQQHPRESRDHASESRDQCKPTSNQLTIVG